MQISPFISSATPAKPCFIFLCRNGAVLFPCVRRGPGDHPVHPGGECRTEPDLDRNGAAQPTRSGRENRRNQREEGA